MSLPTEPVAEIKEVKTLEVEKKKDKKQISEKQRVALSRAREKKALKRKADKITKDPNDEQDDPYGEDVDGKVYKELPTPHWKGEIFRSMLLGSVTAFGLFATFWLKRSPIFGAPIVEVVSEPQKKDPVVDVTMPTPIPIDPRSAATGKPALGIGVPLRASGLPNPWANNLNHLNSSELSGGYW